MIVDAESGRPVVGRTLIIAARKMATVVGSLTEKFMDERLGRRRNDNTYKKYSKKHICRLDNV